MPLCYKLLKIGVKRKLINMSTVNSVKRDPGTQPNHSVSWTTHHVHVGRRTSVHVIAAKTGVCDRGRLDNDVFHTPDVLDIANWKQHGKTSCVLCKHNTNDASIIIESGMCAAYNKTMYAT